MTTPWQLLSTTRNVTLTVDNTDQDQDPMRPWTSSLYIDDVDQHPAHSYGATPQEAVENLFTEHDWTDDLKPYRKQPIIVHAWWSQSSSGFDWDLLDANPDATRQAYRFQFDHDVRSGNWPRVIVVEFDVAGYHPDVEFRDLITEYIDGQLDVITTAQFGRITAHHNQENQP